MRKCSRPTAAIHAMEAGGNDGSRAISPVAIATGRKHATPIGIVSAVPWLGEPVTTPRRAAVMFNAKLAADRMDRMAPSTGDSEDGANQCPRSPPAPSLLRPHP